MHCSETMEREVGIVGGGIIGLSLARELCKRGISSTVYEAKRHVGEGAERASGILSKAGLDRAGIDYESSIVNELYGAVFHAGNHVFRIRAREAKAYVVDRAKLAETCAKRAAESGAEIRLGERLGKEEIRRLAESHKVLVGADGAISTTASTFGFPHIRKRVLTYKAVYKGAAVEDRYTVGLYFDNSVTRGFFGWTVPYSESLMEVAVGIEDKGKTNSKASFDRFTSKEGIRRVIGGGKEAMRGASLIPLETREKTAKDNVLLVGDAAGQVKAATGGGIIFGVGCAKTAADVIFRHINSGLDLEAYEAAWRKRYGTDLALHKMLHGYYSRVGQSGLGMAFAFMKAVNAEKLLSMYGDMDYPTVTLKNILLRSSGPND